MKNTYKIKVILYVFFIIIINKYNDNILISLLWMMMY